MSIGILGSVPSGQATRRRRAFGDLPAGWTSQVPADCFNDQAFSTCYQNQVAAANSQCASRGTPDIGCSVPLADQYAIQNCACDSIGTGTRTDDSSSSTPTPSVTTTVMKPPSTTALAPAPQTFLGMSKNTAILVGVGVAALFAMSSGAKK